MNPTSDIERLYEIYLELMDRRRDEMRESRWTYEYKLHKKKQTTVIGGKLIEDNKEKE